ncbi:hypothetical protein A0H81_13510, partial [Grifola frondosa]
MALVFCICPDTWHRWCLNEKAVIRCVRVSSRASSASCWRNFISNAVAAHNEGCASNMPGYVKAARSLRCSLRPILPPSSFATDLLADSTSAWAPLTLRLPKSWGFLRLRGGHRRPRCRCRPHPTRLRLHPPRARGLPSIYHPSLFALAPLRLRPLRAQYIGCASASTLRFLPTVSFRFSSTSGSFSVTSSLLRSVRS